MAGTGQETGKALESSFLCTACRSPCQALFSDTYCCRLSTEHKEMETRPTRVTIASPVADDLALRLCLGAPLDIQVNI